ncbi:MAG: beta-galactosidase [Firmicutes bacterium]|nr:beta-galactosidase [Bacillota bacterium]
MQDSKPVQYSFTPRSLTRDGKPWMPTMGEFHYSRYPHRHWGRELAKMKAGGIDIVASYVLWIHHEEEEGKISFDGNLNIRQFVESAAGLGMLVFLRIGPWVHSEARNGGFPDWIVNRHYLPRSNDPAYLEDVRRFYEVIFRQVDGLFYKQGGPIIGVQIENEYAHAGGGLKGAEGEAHMRALTQMAKDIGYDVPYWTATGWGGAVTGGLLPVMGGYPEAPWDPRTAEIEPSANFVFSPQRNDHAIACDYGPGSSITFDPALYPYLTAELGSGLQATAHRRPVVTAKDVEALSVCKLGSGTSLLGYYMFHGGTNPIGRLSTFQESKATGYPNDLPVFTFDYGAPIGESGQIRGSYRKIRRLGMFLREFGDALSNMRTTFPPGNPENPSNFDALRHTQRDDGNGGYIFVNNYQRRHVMADHFGKSIEAVTEQGRVEFPPRDIRNGQCFFWPFNMPIGDAVLERATASPLCVLHRESGDIPVFYTDDEPAYQWKVPPKSGCVLTLSQADSSLAAKIKSSDGEHLLLWDGVCYQNDAGETLLEGPGAPTIRIWPALPQPPGGYTRLDDSDDFAVYALPQQSVSDHVSPKEIDRSPEETRYLLSLQYTGEMRGALLRVNGIFDEARLYVNNQFVNDYFYNGEDWVLDMERYGYPDQIELLLTPLRIDQQLYLDRWPDLPKGTACGLTSVELLPICIWRLPL